MSRLGSVLCFVTGQEFELETRINYKHCEGFCELFRPKLWELWRTICLMVNLNYQGYFYIALPLLRTHFDVWPLIANKNAEWSSRKYLILRRAHISVCPSSTNQRPGQACRPIRGSEETSRDPHRDQQALGCFKSPLLWAPECFIPVSHHFVCARGNKEGGSGRVV